MMKRFCFAANLALIFILWMPAYAEQRAEAILKTIVKVKSHVPGEALTARTLGTEREGHGVIIDSNGHILTIGYLILEAERIEVINREGKSMGATFVGYDHKTGFGLLRAEESLALVPMQLGQSSEVKEGDPVLVAGHGGPESVQGARVVFRGEFAGYWEYLLDNAIYTAPPYSDFGGAALIGPDGKLLGIGSIFTQKTIPGLGLIPCNMFVPIDLLKPILGDLITGSRSRRSSQPWLGLQVDEVQGRVFVLRITPGGPAEKAGLQPGDIILTVNRIPVKGLADFYRKVWSLGNAGIEVPLSVLHEIRVTDLVVHSAERNQFLELKPKD